MGIAERHSDYYDNIRNPQLAACAEEVEGILRFYGIMDIEFDRVMEMTREALFSLSGMLEPDDSDDDEDVL